MWLDNWLNRAGRPNENYARELMELFALGIGHYSETDVREVSRALTGWTVQNYRQADSYNGATFLDNPATHDAGSKTILGQTGNWNGYDAIRIILDHSDSDGSVSGRFLGAKLWSFFAHEKPPPHVVALLRDVYVSTNHSVREVVRAILTHPEFYEAHTRKTWVRSPAEYAVAAVRMVEAQTRLRDARELARRHGAGALQPGGREGLGLGDVVDEHRDAVRPLHHGERAVHEPRIATARGSTRTACWRGATPPRPRRSWTSWRSA